FQGRYKGAVLDRHAAEREGTEIPTPAELFWGVVPAMLISIPGYGSIEASKRPLVGFPRERDHVCTMGEHLFHPFKGMHGIVCDDEDGAVVPHLPDLLVSKVHQVDMKDIGAGFPEKLCQSC